MSTKQSCFERSTCAEPKTYHHLLNVLKHTKIFPQPPVETLILIPSSLDMLYRAEIRMELYENSKNYVIINLNLFAADKNRFQYYPKTGFGTTRKPILALPKNLFRHYRKTGFGIIRKPVLALPKNLFRYYRKTGFDITRKPVLALSKKSISILPENRFRYYNEPVCFTQKLV